MAVSKRCVLATVAIDLVAGLGFFGLSLYRFSAGLAIPRLSLSWELCEAALLLFSWLPALHFLSFSLALGSSPREEEVMGAILPAAFLSALLACALLLGNPALERRKTGIERASARFNASLAESRAALQEGRLIEARKAFAVVASIDSADDRVAELEESLSGAELRASQSLAPVAAPAPKPTEKIGPETASEYYEKALDYYGKRDFFSAQWYASEAARIDPRLTDASLLATRAWKEGLSRGGSPQDEKRAAFYARKLDAYGRLRAGDFLEAYRLFSILAAEDKSDPELRNYLAESRAGLERVAFFKDEETKALAGNAYYRFFAVLKPAKSPSSPGEAPLLVLAAREAAFTSSAAFFSDVEFLDGSGSTAGYPGLRIRAEGAKLSGGKLLFVSVDRERPSLRELPAWNLPAASAAQAEPPSSVDLPLSPSDAFLIAAARSAPQSLGVLQLFQAATIAPRFGLDPSALVLELLRRLGVPFALLSASILGAFVGGRFRMASGQPRGISWLSLPLMAGVSALAYRAAEQVDGLLSLFASRVASGLASLGVSAGIRTAFLFVVIVLAASLGKAPRPDGGSAE